MSDKFLNSEIKRLEAKVAELEKNQIQLKLDKLKMVREQGMERISQLTKIVELEKVVELAVDAYVEYLRSTKCSTIIPSTYKTIEHFTEQACEVIGKEKK